MVGTTIVGALSLMYNGHERFVDFVALHDLWQLDEILITLVFFGLASIIPLCRRERVLRREINRREATEDLATKLARHDPLTGAANRRVLVEALETVIARKADADQESAVFVIDLDLFKQINDIHGHIVGDAVLIEVAARLTAVVGSIGIVARMGGDEFACVISYRAGSEVLSRLASQMLKSLSEPIVVEGIQLKIGATIGIAMAPGLGTTGSMLLHGADLAMYEGKRGGRGVCRFFDEEMELRLRDRSELAQDLRLAVGAGEIIPHFQPIVDLASGDLVGFEALARWVHPSRGLISPDTFIPIAEDIGVIDAITYAMLRAACIAARDWPPSLSVSVNVSPLQLKDPWLASRLLAILTETGFAPGRLIIEVTENALIEDMPLTQAIFASLQDSGVRIALDDFGKGYSSLYHLRELRFDQLKIDRSFVHSLGCSESAKIVAAITGLGKSLGMPVTAEGVETSEEAGALRALGCETAQGFLFGKAVGAEETIVLLNQIAARKFRHLRRA